MQTLMAICAAAAFAHSVVFAAPITRKLDFQVKATIPATQSLTITPEADWQNTPLELKWDEATGALQPVTSKKLNIKSSKSITAKLQSAAALTLGKNSIPLTIKIGAKELTTAAQEVATDAEATKGHDVQVVVSPTSNAPHYASGDYTATVAIIFEANI
jgi:hypothetical protein